MSKVIYIRLWLWVGILLIVLMIVVGGITRLTGSGLSIVEWNVISGTIPPITEIQWQHAFDQYKQFPQYKKLNYGMDMAQFKQIFFWEYVHRLLGRFIGLVFLLPFLFFYFARKLSKSLTKKLLVIFALGALQGFMGWYMVKSGLNDNPHVSHFRLAIHQSLALLLIVSILWTILTLDERKTASNNPSSLLILIYLSLALLSFQIVLGAFVAGLKAGFSYTNFPLMGDTFFPSAIVMRSKPYLYNGVMLQFTHRWVAFVVFLSFLWILKISRPYSKAVKYARILIVIGITQVVLGITTLMLRVPLALGVIHQFIAIILLMLLIKIIHTIKYPMASEILKV
ncbi:MAG: COX15/CtaA family protein [Cyclobacteriaceae bacterium]